MLFDWLSTGIGTYYDLINFCLSNLGTTIYLCNHVITLIDYNIGVYIFGTYIGYE